MLFKNINDIFEIVPPVSCDGINNRQLPPAEQMYFKVYGVNIVDKDNLDIQSTLDRNRLTPEKAMEEYHKRLCGLVREKFVSLHNYFIETPDGLRAVTDFDEFRQIAPPELVQWLFSVIMSGEALSAAERKNFSPESASA